MPSFDVVSEPDMHEFKMLLTVLREVRQRYDFQGTDAALEQLDDNVAVQLRGTSSSSGVGLTR